MLAHCLLRDNPWYRREAFMQGLKAAGHDVVRRQPDKPDANTLLVIWNRYGGNHDLATKVEATGGVVVVAENGYVSPNGGVPKFEVHPLGPRAHHYYSISQGHHNDDSVKVVPDPFRFQSMRIELKP